MEFTHTTSLDQRQKQDLLTLWNTEYPEKLNFASISALETYLHDLQDLNHLLLLNDSKLIVGWAFSFERTTEDWFAIILSEEAKNKGYGTQMLNTIKARHNILNGWVIDHDHDLKADGQPYRSPLDFYKKNNFAVIPLVRLETEKISAVKIQWKKETMPT